MKICFSTPLLLITWQTQENVFGYTIKYRLQRENTNLDEAFVETEVVPNGVLPALLVVLVIRELHCNVLVDACNKQDFKVKSKL